MTSWAPALALLLATTATVHADRWRDRAERWQGGAWLHYELTGLQQFDAPRGAPGHETLVLAGVRLHGFVGQNATVAYHVGLDLAAGSTLGDAGLAYDVALLPIGVVVRARRTAVFGLALGVGASGAVGTLDDAVTLPVDLTAELGDGRYRVLARARFAYVAGARSRQSAAAIAPFADEAEAMLGLRLGRHYEQHGFPSGNGYFLAASYRELAGARFVGFTLGYSIDLATQRR